MGAVSSVGLEHRLDRAGVDGSNPPQPTNIMKIIDLTHSIAENMPMYPGTDAPVLDVAYNHNEYGFMETFISMYSHCHTVAKCFITAIGLKNRVSPYAVATMAYDL